ncbi:hypothetical protein TNCT_154611 [Trichonephila clavata]|uniref:Uncharacterized protein n=1 Tax=Trichonephila clavata TaxID=2740835 RepID=A0A8X6FKW0_TRICU|nr:hypothetical protein TNCT_154611 [Trichonephila clavata]
MEDFGKGGAELHPVRSGSSSQTISGMEDEEQTIFFGSGGGFRTKNAPTVFRMQQTHFGRAVASLPFLSPGQPIGEIRCHDVTTCGTRTSWRKGGSAPPLPPTHIPLPPVVVHLLRVGRGWGGKEGGGWGGLGMAVGTEQPLCSKVFFFCILFSSSLG